MKKRRVTKPVYVGDVKVGGGAEITVQSMTKTDTRDVKATVRQIHELEEVGCDIIRSAVPDMEAAKAMAEIRKQINIPLIADIHFHYQLAIECAMGGVDCLRLNPGNLRNEDQVKEVVKVAKERDIPIRIGVNFGSLPPVGGIGRTRGFSRHMDLVNQLPKAGEAREGEYSIVDHMVATALWEISLLEQQDFDQIKISLKAFDVPTTVEAYRQLADMVPYPFHLGITEAGTAQAGSIRTAVGLGFLLYEGIGDTIPRLSQRRLDGRGSRRLRDSQVPQPAHQGHHPGGLPQLRPGRRGRAQAGQRRGRPAEEDGQEHKGCGHGLRGQRARRGQGCRRGHRRRRRSGGHFPQGPEGDGWFPRRKCSPR